MDQDDHMYTDLPTTDPAHTLQALTEGPLPATLSALSASSRGIPSEKDFHFFNNFDEFKLPIHQIAAKSQSLLQTIGGSSGTLLRESLRFPGGGDGDFDVEEAYDWLVNVNDEILERIDASLDEYGRLRKEEEEGSGRVSATGLGMEEGGFQVVHGRKKKTKGGLVVVPENTGGVGGESVAGVKVADNKKLVMGAKAKVPFHIPTIRRPQEEFNILVNNGNQPFQHVWLEKSDDGSRFVHPLEKVNVSDFVDWSAGDAEPMAPPPLASTPFKFVEEVKDLKQLAAKLRGVTEFAVDLEHNQYRSFQGLTCLMQISTRNEDYVVDTLKLKIHVGPHLREVFKDPTKRKVMHGADRDIVWLQRDFGIYVCNLFDTGQASRKLKLERNSLEYLLNHFCGVTANKEYQNADWRLRPLPEEMIRYAREDTHYLLHIYDKMRIILLSVPKENENADSPLLEVYKRSYDICTQLYEKELLTENSYLHIYGLQDTGFNAQQLSVVSGLFEWRDAVARAEDESTGYILPNKTLLEIAKQMPVTTSKLRRILKSKHSYVERNLSSVVSIIRHSVQNAGAFEAAAQQLQEARIEMISQDNTEDVDEGGTPASGTPNLGTANSAKDAFGGSSVGSSVNNLQTVSTGLGKKPLGPGNNSSTDGKGDSFEYHGENGNMMVSSPSQDTSTCPDKPLLGKATGATVQVLKNPAGAFGALLGSSASKRNVDTEKKNKEEMKLDKIRSSVYLPFQSFLHRNEVLTPLIQEPPGAPSLPNSGESIAAPATNPKVEDVVVLDDDSDVEQQNDESETVNLSRDAKPIGLVGDIIILEDDSDFEQENNDSKTTDVHGDDKLVGHSPEEDGQDEPVSLSDLSSSFQKCFQSNNESRKTSDSDESLKQENCKPFKPFNYAAAMRFWEEPAKKTKDPDDEEKRGSSDSGRSSAKGRGQKEDGTRDFPPARRRQAFPTTGNRSATFR